MGLELVIPRFYSSPCDKSRDSDTRTNRSFQYCHAPIVEVYNSMEWQLFLAVFFYDPLYSAGADTGFFSSTSHFQNVKPKKISFLYQVFV